MTIPLADPSHVDDGRQSPAAAALAKGVRRLLWAHGFATIPELTLANDRRADIVGLSEASEIWIVEIKSSIADFRSDAKWQDYRAYCDRLLFAVDRSFPLDILPVDCGVIAADQYGGELVRPAPEHWLAGARRKAVIARFARAAASRLLSVADPDFKRELEL